ncbi:MAG: alpha/beta hydrolase [Actinobacteria bacterium]|nr:alpha/beta hydrolase [Actinomycetota bacterium]
MPQPPGYPRLPEGRLLSAGGIQLFCRDSGSAPGCRRPVVLLHGLTSTADLCWFAVMPRLADRHRCLALDLPGHGSSPPLVPCSVAQVADLVGEVIGSELREPAIVVGFSMGGMIAQELWRRHRGLVAGLVLCSTAAELRPDRFTGRWAVQPSRRLAVSLAGRAPASLRAPLGDRARAAAVARSARTGDASELQRWARGQLERNDPIGVAAASVALRRHDARTWLSDIDVPVATVTTTRDTVVDVARQRALTRALEPVASLEVDADHGAFVEDPERWAPAVVDAVHAVDLSRDQPPARTSPGGR